MHRSLRCRYTLLTGGAQAKAALSAALSVAGLINTPLRRHMAPAMFEMLVLEHEFTTLILKTAMDSENQARYMDVSVYEAELENDSDIELASEADDASSSDEV